MSYNEKIWGISNAFQFQTFGILILLSFWFFNVRFVTCLNINETVKFFKLSKKRYQLIFEQLFGEFVTCQ